MRKIRKWNRKIIGAKRSSLSFFMILIFTLTLGFSFLASSLVINAVVKIRAQADIRVTGVSKLSSENSGNITQNPEYYKEGVYLYTTLPEINSTVTYEIAITNNKEFAYLLQNINTVTSSNDSIEYIVDETGLKINDRIGGKNTGTVHITIKYKETVTQIPEVNTSTINLSFVFEEMKSVTIDLDGGTSNQELTHYLKNGETLEIEIPVKDGYNFSNWSVTGDGSSIEGNNFTMGSENTTIKAIWNPINYNITYNLNGGSANNNVTYNIETQTFTLNNPTKDGYTFTGWTGSNGNVETMEVVIEKGSFGDKTYTANWTLATYTISYNLNGGTQGASPITSYTIETATFNLPIPTKTGYTFIGWNENSYMTGNNLSSIEKGSSGNKSLYANWVANTYTVTYSCNGGSGSTTTSIHKYDTVLPLSSNECYKVVGGTGGMVYYMSGWATTANATTPEYTDKESVENLTLDSNVTLYAVWTELFKFEKNSLKGSYTVIDDGNGDWRIKFLETGKFTSYANISTDIFLVGGGAGGFSTGYGGGGGFTHTESNVAITANNSYDIEVGKGGTSSGGAGGKSFVSLNNVVITTVNGGSGMTGGSGGGARWGGNGGYNGSNGGRGAENGEYGGSGQGTNTYEFGDTSLTLYAGGGGANASKEYPAGSGGAGGGGTGGNHWTGVAATPGGTNTGGGGGGSWETAGASGGSGIVVMRNTRYHYIGDIIYTYTGTQEAIDDGNGNWRIKFKTNGILSFISIPSDLKIDLFLVGGGAGGYSTGSGGGGGYTHTENEVSVTANTSYNIVVGIGGVPNGGAGGSSSFGGLYTVNGGSGMNGGSGGGAGWAGNGGSNGSNGGFAAESGVAGGTGQKRNTYEFGDPTLTLYAGGGGASATKEYSAGIGGAGGGGTGGNSWYGITPENGKENTGGGGGGSNGVTAGNGGSGIVVIRNTRYYSVGNIVYTYSGAHETIDDGNGNWRLKLKSSGILNVVSVPDNTKIDVFLVGGGAGGFGSGEGGGGGYTHTEKSVAITAKKYNIVVGYGGQSNNDGNASVFDGLYTANGGSGINGGSGGGGRWAGTGGYNGSNGGQGVESGGLGGTGQGRTTCEFEIEVSVGVCYYTDNGHNGLYSGGGGSSATKEYSAGIGGKGGGGTGGNGWTGVLPTNGQENTGGGGGGRNGLPAASGGTGIVIIRNA